MFKFELDKVTKTWRISSKAGKFSAIDFITYISKFFKDHNLELKAESVFGKKFDHYFLPYLKSSYEVLPGKEKHTMFESWITIILDYVQSAIYGHSYRKYMSEGISAKDADKKAMNLVKEFSIHLTGKPNLFGN